MNSVIELSGYEPRTPRRPPTLLKVSSVPVEPLFGTLSRVIRKFRSEIFSEPCQPEHRWFYGLRHYRQRFCKLAREFSGLTSEELCARLNEHPGILGLKCLPSFDRFYPISQELLSDLENSINKIMEYNPYGGGFLGIGAYGIPTETIAEAIADICGGRSEYQKVEQWCFEFRYGESQEWRR